MKRVSVPVAFSITVIIACKVFFTSCTVSEYAQRLVDATKQVVCVVWADADQSGYVFLDFCWRESPHEVEHRVDEVTHGCRGSRARDGLEGGEGVRYEYALPDRRGRQAARLKAD